MLPARHRRRFDAQRAHCDGVRLKVRARSLTCTGVAAVRDRGGAGGRSPGMRPRRGDGALCISPAHPRERREPAGLVQQAGRHRHAGQGVGRRALLGSVRPREPRYVLRQPGHQRRDPGLPVGGSGAGVRDRDAHAAAGGGAGGGCTCARRPVDLAPGGLELDAVGARRRNGVRWTEHRRGDTLRLRRVQPGLEPAARPLDRSRRRVERAVHRQLPLRGEGGRLPARRRRRSPARRQPSRRPPPPSPPAPAGRSSASTCRRRTTARTRTCPSSTRTS